MSFFFLFHESDVRIAFGEGRLVVGQTLPLPNGEIVEPEGPDHQLKNKQFTHNLCFTLIKGSTLDFAE
jgi:hypothetical protein